MLPISGMGLLVMVSGKVPDSCTTVPGITTLTFNDPILATSLLVMTTFRCCKSTGRDGRVIPFTLTSAVLVNPLPVNPRVKLSLPAVTLAGVRPVNVGIPEPVRFTKVVLPATAMLPRFSPPETGAKLTVTVQLAPAGREVPQLLVCGKPEPALIPVIGVVPAFVRVTDCGALTVPTV